MIKISKHAAKRIRNRGISNEFLHALIDNADVDVPIGSNCRLMRVHRKTANKLNMNDRLSKYAVIWSDDHNQIVTVLPMHKGKKQNRYSRMH
jgi:hypothetical protein